MIEFNTAKRDYFKTQTSSSSNNTYDLEKAFLTENSYKDWRAYFYSYGYTDSYTLHITNLWWRWLTEKGFTQGSLRGKLHAFYVDGSVNL